MKEMKEMEIMKIMKIMRMGAILLFLGGVGSLSAQNASVQRELTLEKEYAPSVQDASKINSLPEVKEPEPTKAAIEYIDFSTPYDVRLAIFPLHPGKYFTDLQSSKKRGYLNVGAGTFINLNVDAGYQLVNSPSDKLSLFYSNRFSDGNVNYLQHDTTGIMKINDNVGGFSYLHNFNSCKLYADARYTYSEFNYYGNGWDKSFSTDGRSSQANNIADVRAGLASRNEKEWHYLLDFNYSYFQQKYLYYFNNPGLKENYFKAKLDVGKNFSGTQWIGLGGYVRTMFYDTDDLNHINVALNPYYKIDDGTWALKLGAWVHFLFNYEDNMAFSPDVEFIVHPTEKMALYLQATGELKDNSKKPVFYENRYTLPSCRIKDSNTMLDAVAGFKSSVIPNFWFDFFAGYRITKDEHFYRQTQESTVFYDSLGVNFSEPDYVNAKVFKAGTHLKYQWRNQFEAGLKAVYYHYTLDGDELDGGPRTFGAWNKPQFEADFQLGYSFPFPLRIDLAYHLETGREQLISDQVVSMDDVYELNLQGTYSISDSFSFYIKANNLLFQRYDLWYGYPAQGFNAMLGISIKF